jgi:GNAT superfamily N-acetyltransferase
MLNESYDDLLVELPSEKREELLTDWASYDDAVHDEPDSVGSAGFLSLIAEEAIGFASWDPRGWPEVGHIGHHCIRPGFQRRGHGTGQVERVLEIFRACGFRMASVHTDEHAFFAPARRIYQACGFRHVGQAPGTLLAGSMTMVYELELDVSSKTQTHEVDE